MTRTLWAQTDPACSVKTVGELLDQGRTDPSNVFWTAAGVVVGLAVAERLNTKIAVSVTVPGLKMVSDYFVAQNLRSQLSKFSREKRVQVCSAHAADSLLPRSVAAILGLKEVILITEPTVNVSQLKHESPVNHSMPWQPEFDRRLLDELSLQGNALNLRQNAIAPESDRSRTDVFGSVKFPGLSPEDLSRFKSSTQLPKLAEMAPLVTTIKVRTYDAANQLPIGDATLQLAPAAEPRNWVGAGAAANGDFHFTILKGINYQLSAFAPGYYGAVLFVDGGAQNAGEFRMLMVRRSSYPCTFRVENMTPWLVEWQSESSTWRSLDAFRTVQIPVNTPGHLNATTVVGRGPAASWKNVPVNCEGSGYVTLTP